MESDSEVKKTDNIFVSVYKKEKRVAQQKIVVDSPREIKPVAVKTEKKVVKKPEPKKKPIKKKQVAVSEKKSAARKVSDSEKEVEHSLEGKQEQTNTVAPVKKAAAASPVVAVPKVTFDREAYFASIRSIISSNKKYPAIAKRRGIQGRVVLQFIVLKDGSVKSQGISESSGFSILDRAALLILEESTPFPNPPEDISFTLPIVFGLS
jgi:protein TonB